MWSYFLLICFEWLKRTKPPSDLKQWLLWAKNVHFLSGLHFRDFTKLLFAVWKPKMMITWVHFIAKALLDCIRWNCCGVGLSPFTPCPRWQPRRCLRPSPGCGCVQGACSPKEVFTQCVSASCVFILQVLHVSHPFSNSQTVFNLMLWSCWIRWFWCFSFSRLDLNEKMRLYSAGTDA